MLNFYLNYNYNSATSLPHIAYGHLHRVFSKFTFLFFSFPGRLRRLYPHGWHTNVDRHLDCSREAFILHPKKVGLVQVWSRTDPKVRSTHYLDLDLKFGSGPTTYWPGHSDLWVRSGPDPGPRGPGPNSGQSRFRTELWHH